MKFAIGENNKIIQLDTRIKASLILLFLFSYLISSCICIKLKSKISLTKKKWDDDDPEFANSSRIPLVNLHIEDHDSDIANFRRFDGERKTLQIGLQEMQVKYEYDKRALLHLLAMQSSKLAQLSVIADSTNYILKALV